MTAPLTPISETLVRLLAHSGRAVMLRDKPGGREQAVSADLAAAPDGLLPIFLAAGEAVWRDATGMGFGLRLVRDQQSLLGYRAEGLGGAAFSTVMLCTMEAIERVAQPGVLPVNALNTVWRDATERAAPTLAPWAGASPGASP